MKILVYLGTGGVGKTSVAAATSVAQARAGDRSLVLTIDPSLRLRSALRLEDGRADQKVTLEPPAPGELWAALLDVRATLEQTVRRYGTADVTDRVLRHPIYAAISDSLAGMQELMAVEKIDQLASSGFEHIVVDTAPSRHALEFLDKPMFLAEMVGATWVKLVGRTYRILERTGMAAIGRKTLDMYARVESIVGTGLSRQILDFYSLFVSVAEGYADRASKTVAMLKDPKVTEFRIVTTPHKALRDAEYFVAALSARQFPIGGIYVNRVWQHDLGPARVEGLARDLVEWYGSVRDSHVAAVEQLRANYAFKVGKIGVLPELERDIEGLPALERLATQLSAP